jgi:hypothetical protein
MAGTVCPSWTMDLSPAACPSVAVGSGLNEQLNAGALSRVRTLHGVFPILKKRLVFLTTIGMMQHDAGSAYVSVRINRARIGIVFAKRI